MGVHQLDHCHTQQTLAAPTSVTGRGYWTGREVEVTFRPAPADHGIVFARTDLPGCPEVVLDVQSRLEIPRRTCLVSGDAQVDMVEHIMAALAGLGIDQCRVEMSSQEAPGCDGSSQWFVDAVDRVGTISLNAERRRRRVSTVTRVGNEESWVEARPVAGEQLKLTYELSYDMEGPIGRQILQYEHSTAAFRRELASARTFVTEAEAAWLRSEGLGVGVSHQDLLVFGPDGPIDNPLRFDDECVRHKTLDLLGDLALSGCDWIGEFVSFRSGHRLNAELVRTLLMDGELRKTA
jgi:UDP-3-O-[3-hydroxymyristoyl] N-acetylglucosamine deacetylase